MIRGLLLLSVLCTSLLASPPELGKVAWERSYEKGMASAAKSGKPVFLLFQEVPG
jgi:hypothetical protein